MEKVGVGVIGFGTVGTGVVKVLLQRKNLLAQRSGFLPELLAVCDIDLKRRRLIPVPSKILTTDVAAVLNNPEIKIVVELVGGIEPAGSLILEALKRGKSVITANKALLAEKGDRIFAAAEKFGCHVGFEGSVGGAIPIIKSLRESFVADRITSLYGILNGTTNFILTRMAEDRISLEKALKIAQNAGFAERNSSLDLSGLDSSHKLSVLATLITGKFFPASDILTEGIAGITLEDLQYADELGYGVKLLSILRRDREGTGLATYPALIPKQHLLSSIRDVYNAIYLTGDLIGESLLFGKGAGMDPTASSVVSDIVSIGKDIIHRTAPAPLPYYSHRAQKVSSGERIARYYLRFTALDQPGVLAKVSAVLGKFGISIASCIQMTESRPRKAVPVVFLSHKARESAVQKAITIIDGLPVIKAKTVLMRLAFDE
ncbi:MAG: homoserine dehydrogenase [Candidatus Omnitrophota bacterium]